MDSGTEADLIVDNRVFVRNTALKKNTNTSIGSTFPDFDILFSTVGLVCTNNSVGSFRFIASDGSTYKEIMERLCKEGKRRKDGKEVERGHTQYSKTQQKDKLHFCESERIKKYELNLLFKLLIFLHP